jgi:predicted alpha-1,6-mannanase (GH76 family)
VRLPVNKTNFCLLAFFFLSVRLALPAADDFNAESAAAAATLQQYYGKNGLWHTTGWWNAANCVEALENAAAADNGQTYLGVLAHTYQLNCRSNFLNDYYDDEGWWALAWIHAYDLTGKPQYLNSAKFIFGDMTKSWNDHCGGGLEWSKKHLYKNAIPNELFLLAAIRLHQRTPADHGPGSYLDWATKEWVWFKNSGMINPQDLVNDGLNRECENNGRTTWTYNQGVIIGGLTDLYKATGDTNYLNQATMIANAAIAILVDDQGVLQEPCEENGCGGGDVPQFKGIFIRYLAYLYDETHNPAYRDFLLANARSVWADDRDAENHLGLKWGGPFDSADAARQSSAMMAISALAEPATKNLPFAKGAGSVTFNHEVGAASGTLAWTCDGNNAAAPGTMLAGACASLAGGSHVLHFRMGVNENKDSTENLVRLDIKESANGNVLASRQIRWNEFLATNQPVDFQLAFRTATIGTPLEFQVYWNHAPDAPSLTLTDVTIDGAHNWTAANLAHEIGRLDGLNGWEADPIRDTSSGYLINGPGTGELPAGNCRALFELKVDNFNWDKSKVATLSVVNSSTGKIAASQDVTRDLFPDTLYHSFTLNFQAEAGQTYEFRVFWYFAPDAPRLTQRSVLVQARDVP